MYEYAVRWFETSFQLEDGANRLAKKGWRVISVVTWIHPFGDRELLATFERPIPTTTSGGDT